MMVMIKLACLLLLLAVGAARWENSHFLTGNASRELSTAIRAQLYATPHIGSTTW
jgi:hypothetical protein